LFKHQPDVDWLARYRRYLNRTDMRRDLTELKRRRGRKSFRPPAGSVYDLCHLFEELNHEYFGGLMARPELGWSLRRSMTTLGHYDPCHHVIVLSSILDSPEAPPLAVKYVMFHEMLHLRFPTQIRGARRCVHTADFKAAEREFKQFETAKRQLRLFLDSRQ
jgi:SprT-like family